MTIHRWSNGDRTIVVDNRDRDEAFKSFHEIVELYFKDTTPEEWVYEVRGF